MAVYGLDIGGTKIETAIFNDILEQQQSWRISTPTQNYQEFLEAIHQQVLKADLENAFAQQQKQAADIQHDLDQQINLSAFADTYPTRRNPGS